MAVGVAMAEEKAQAGERPAWGEEAMALGQPWPGGGSGSKNEDRARRGQVLWLTWLGAGPSPKKKSPCAVSFKKRPCITKFAGHGPRKKARGGVAKPLLL